MKLPVSQGVVLCLRLSFRKSGLLFVCYFFFVGIQLKLHLLICKACATPTLHERLITLHEIQIIRETFSNVFCMCYNFPPHFLNVTLKLSNAVRRLGSNILCFWLIDARFASLNCFQCFVRHKQRGSWLHRALCFIKDFAAFALHAMCAWCPVWNV